MTFSLNSRHLHLERAAENLVDVVVIGAGITGCGVAREAALAGHSVALLDKGDFASGTSSRSSKLIHGGVRYLAQGDVALVKEAARERAVLRRMAPHLATPTRMLIPVSSRRGRLKMSAGLWTFDRLAGDGNDPHVVLDRDEVLAAQPGLRPEHVAGGVSYTEFVTNDARLTLETARSAVEAGAWAAHYANVVRIDDEASGLRVTVDDGLTGGRLVIRAKCVVNAAGPWFDRVRGLHDACSTPLLQLTRGIHLVFPRALLPVSHSVVLRAPDGRSTFIVPRDRYVYVGTTDTLYDGAPEEPGVSIDDASYLLDCLRYTFADPPSASAIVGTWSGVRPLLRQDGKSASEISRRDEIHVGPGPVVAVAGGKLTTYRRMAERVVEKVVTLIGPAPSRNGSSSSPLVGGSADDQARARIGASKTADAQLDERLWRTYGAQAGVILERAAARRGADRIGDLEDMCAAEVDFAVEYEMVATLDDLLRRRAAVGMFDIERAVAAAPAVAAVLADRLGWTPERAADEARRFAEDRIAELATVRSVAARGAA